MSHEPQDQTDLKTRRELIWSLSSNVNFVHLELSCVITLPMNDRFSHSNLAPWENAGASHIYKLTTMCFCCVPPCSICVCDGHTFATWLGRSYGMSPVNADVDAISWQCHTRYKDETSFLSESTQPSPPGIGNMRWSSHRARSCLLLNLWGAPRSDTSWRRHLWGCFLVL